MHRITICRFASSFLSGSKVQHGVGHPLLRIGDGIKTKIDVVYDVDRHVARAGIGEILEQPPTKVKASGRQFLVRNHGISSLRQSVVDKAVPRTDTCEDAFVDGLVKQGPRGFLRLVDQTRNSLRLERVTNTGTRQER